MARADSSLTPFDSVLPAWSGRPPADASERRLKASSLFAPRDDLRFAADRFRAGDFHEALLAAMRVLDARPVPMLIASGHFAQSARLAATEQRLLAQVNGVTPLEEVLEAAGLGLLEGIDAMCELLDLGFCSLAPGDPMSATA